MADLMFTLWMVLVLALAGVTAVLLYRELKREAKRKREENNRE